MENQTKKLRLEDIKVESFVTSDTNSQKTIKGGDTIFGCYPTNGNTCGGITCNYLCNDKTPVDDFTNGVPGCQGPDGPTYPQWPGCSGVSCTCPTEFITCPVSCYKSECPSPGPCQ